MNDFESSRLSWLSIATNNHSFSNYLKVYKARIKLSYLLSPKLTLTSQLSSPMTQLVDEYIQILQLPEWWEYYKI